MAYEPNDPSAESAASAGFSEKSSTATSEAKARASDLGRKAAESVDQVRKTAAGGLGTAAGALDEHADALPGGPRIASAAHRAADALTASADYIRDKNVRDMVDDVMKVVKDNPGPALLGAVALGFLVGRSFTRN
jgi:hypothetical protein